MGDTFLWRSCESCVVSRATEVMPPTWSGSLQPWPHRQRLQKRPEALAAVKPRDLVLGVQPLFAFEGLRGDRVALNDPALDRARDRDFDRSYTGIVLTMERTKIPARRQGPFPGRSYGSGSFRTCGVSSLSLAWR